VTAVSSLMDRLLDLSKNSLQYDILIPDVAEKNILILAEEKKKSDSEFLSYSLMLNSGKNSRALRDKQNEYSNYRVVRKILNETKNHIPLPPLFKLNGRSLSLTIYLLPTSL
jgi:hypothetical protein